MTPGDRGLFIVLELLRAIEYALLKGPPWLVYLLQSDFLADWFIEVSKILESFIRLSLLKDLPKSTLIDVAEYGVAV